MSTPIRDWELERYLQGELDAVGQERVRQAIATDATVSARLAELEASNRAVLQSHPAAAVAAAISARRRTAEARAAAPRPARARRSLLLLAPALVGAAVLVALVRPTHEVVIDAGQPPAADGGNRVKGAPELVMRCRRGADELEMKDGDAARAGDLIQLAYVPAGRVYGLILSIDGAGGVSLHYPESPEGTTRLEVGGATLPHAYELDTAPGFERFFFITGSQPVPVRAVLARARALARDPSHAAREPINLGAGFEESSMLVRKLP